MFLSEGEPSFRQSVKTGYSIKTLYRNNCANGSKFSNIKRMKSLVYSTS